MALLQGCPVGHRDSRLSHMVSHTNRELTLMLAGSKPLAAFLLDGDLTEDQAFSGQPFQAHVEAGRILRFETEVQQNGLSMRRILFTLPGEEWRVEAYCRLMDSMSEGWSDAKERQEGILLGYTDAENDAHIARLRTANP